MITTEQVIEGRIQALRPYVKARLQVHFRGLDQKPSMVDGVCRCGLCCVVLPTKTFDKGSVVCPNLIRTDEVFGCAIYSQRPQGCRGYNCQGRYSELRVLLDDMVLDILSGRNRVTYYVEPDEEGGWSEEEETCQVIASMRRVGALGHSMVAQTFSSSREFGKPEALLLWLTLFPPNSLRNRPPDPRVVEGLGINGFLSRLSSEHTRRLLVATDSLVGGVIGEGDAEIWQRAVSFVRMDLNTDPRVAFETGMRRDLSGDVSLPPQLQQSLSGLGGLQILAPSPTFRSLLQVQLYE